MSPCRLGAGSECCWCAPGLSLQQEAEQPDERSLCRPLRAHPDPRAAVQPGAGAGAALEYVRSGTGCLVAEGPDAFAEAILRLIDDRRLGEEMGAAGRRYVEQRHDWDEIAGQLEAIYAEEAGRGIDD